MVYMPGRRSTWVRWSSFWYFDMVTTGAPGAAVRFFPLVPDIAAALAYTRPPKEPLVSSRNAVKPTAKATVTTPITKTAPTFGPEFSAGTYPAMALASRPQIMPENILRAPRDEPRQPENLRMQEAMGGAVSIAVKVALKRLGYGSSCGWMMVDEAAAGYDEHNAAAPPRFLAAAAERSGARVIALTHQTIPNVRTVDIEERAGLALLRL